jgi:hypothetical protein
MFVCHAAGISPVEAVLQNSAPVIAAIAGRDTLRRHLNSVK